MTIFGSHLHSWNPFVTRYADFSPSSRQNGRIRLSLLLALGILLGGLALAWWLIQQPPRVERRPPPEPSTPQVSVVRGEVREQAPVIQAFGRVEAERLADISSRVGGVLTAFGPNVTPGAVVEAGEVLARIDQADLALALESAQAGLDEAKAALAIEQGEQQRARQEYNTFGRELPALRKALVLREPQLRRVKAQLAKAEVARDQAALALDRATLTAPWPAVVEARQAGVGSLVSQGTALVSLIGVERFWVRAALPGQRLEWLQTGDRVRLSSRGWPEGEQRDARLISILPSLEQNGLQAQLLVEVEDPMALAGPGPALRLGDVMQLDIEGSAAQPLMALPAKALRPDDSVWWVDDQGRLQNSPVTVGYRSDTEVLIRDGLEDGRQVVISELANPSEGQEVQVRGASKGADDTAQNGESP